MIFFILQSKRKLHPVNFESKAVKAIEFLQKIYKTKV